MVERGEEPSLQDELRREEDQKYTTVEIRDTAQQHLRIGTPPFQRVDSDRSTDERCLRKIFFFRIL